MRSVVVIAFLLVSAVVFGQRATIKWDRSTIQMGEQATLRIRIKKPPKKVQHHPLEGEISCGMRSDSSSLTVDGKLEITRPFADTTYSKANEQIWEGVYTVTAWDTGVYVMPVLSVGLSDTTLNLQAPDLKVGFTKQPLADELQEMTAELPDEPSWLETYWWLVFIPLAVVIVLLIRRRNTVKAVKQLSLKQRTQIAIDALKKQAYWKQGKINEHYIEFSFLLRSFLSARYELNLTERTTYETMVLLTKKDIPEDTLRKIKSLLQESDMVKFAKGLPDAEETELSLLRFEELVVELSPLDIVE